MFASFLLHTLITLAFSFLLVMGFWKWVRFDVPFSRVFKRLLIHLLVYVLAWIPTLTSSFALMKHRGTWTVILEGEFSAQPTFFSLLVFYTGVLFSQFFILMFTFEAWKNAAEKDEEETEAS